MKTIAVMGFADHANTMIERPGTLLPGDNTLNHQGFAHLVWTFKTVSGTESFWHFESSGAKKIIARHFGATCSFSQDPRLTKPAATYGCSESPSSRLRIVW